MDFDNFIPFIRYVPNVGAMSVSTSDGSPGWSDFAVAKYADRAILTGLRIRLAAELR